MPEREFTYLDNAATTFPKPAVVYESADSFYRRFGGNAGRGANPFARKGAELLSDVRALLAEWLNAPSPERVVFAPSATIALNQMILGAQLRSDDSVYVSPFEHNSVLRPVEYLRQKLGVSVLEMPFDRESFTCCLDQLDAMFLSEPPTLVCVAQASNVCGAMPPATEIARRAKSVNPRAIIVVDGAQTAGLHPLGLDTGLIDAYIFSGHKSLYAPYGVAGLVLSSSWRPAPILFGGTGTASESVAMPEEPPSSYEPGSHNIPALAGLQAALTWLNETGRDQVRERTLALAEDLRTGLEQLPGVTLQVPPEEGPWCGIVSFTVRNVRPQALEAVLGARGIAVRAGLHCAPWAHRWLGTLEDGGTLRVSTSWFNETRDLDMLMTEISKLNA